MTTVRAIRRLGNSGLTVPPICFGGNVFGWTLDEKASFDMLDRLLDHGLHFIDTADVYSRWGPGNSGGESEAIIGRWMKSRGSRARVILATKVGAEMGPGREGLSAAYIETAIEDSLRRLQTDYVDLYQAHFEDPRTPVEVSLGSFARLIDAGKVRVIGASNYSATGIGAALDAAAASGLPRYESLQVQYNLYDRSAFEQELLDICRERKLGVLTYFSLAAGFLSGKYRTDDDLSKSVRGNRTVHRYMTPRGRKILAALDEVAAEVNLPVASIALSWLVGRDTVTSAIASATRSEQLGELIEGAAFVLPAEARARLDEASS